jgi:hypothetical protein
MVADTAAQQPVHKLAQRLLHHVHPQGPTATELFVERLPEGLTPEFPLPSGATLIGSLVRWRHGRPWSLEVVLDALDVPAVLLAAYEVWTVAATATHLPSPGSSTIGTLRKPTHRSSA